ncbi:MAG: DUF2887 domain-containing protein [Cyanobacteria bacterium P01_F01_bin.150]
MIIYGSRACEQEELGAHKKLIQDGYVRRIYLDEFAQKDEESLLLGLVRLIVEPVDSAIPKAQQLAQLAQKSAPDESVSYIMELIETILVYKFPSIGWQEIREMFGISELKQTRVYQEGEEKGRETATRSIILRLLNRRFDDLSESLLTKINQLPVEALEQLAEDLLDFADLNDLYNWLKRYLSVQDEPQQS